VPRKTTTQKVGHRRARRIVLSARGQVRGLGDAAPTLFYGRLFEIAPQVRPMFPEDVREQGKKLMAALAMVVGGLTNLPSILPAASAMAKRHVDYGVEADHYPVVGEALLWTLGKGLGEAWTPELQTAWTSAYGVLSGYMVSEAYGDSAAAG